MSQKVLKVSNIPYIDFEETIVATPDDIVVLPDQLYGYLPAPTPLPNVALGKAVAASSSAGGITPQPAYLGNDGTGNAWFSEYSDGWPRWWSVDLGASFRILKFRVELAGFYGDPANNLKSFEVQHSADNSSWTTIYSITDNPATTAGGLIEQTQSPPVTDRYWRVLIQENNGDTYSRINELLLYGYVPVPLAPQEGDLAGDTTATRVSGLLGYPLVGSPTAPGQVPTFHSSDGTFRLENPTGRSDAYEPPPVTPVNVSPAGTVTASSQNGSETAANATNGINFTSGEKWTSLEEPAWIALEWPTERRFNGYKLYLAGNIESASYNARDWLWQRWDAVAADWVTVDSVSGNTANTVERAVSPFNATKLRLYVSFAGGDGYVRILEWLNYGYDPVLLSAATRSGDLGGTDEATQVVAIGGVPIDDTSVPDATNNTFSYDPATTKIKWLPGGSGGGGGGPATALDTQSADPLSPPNGRIYLNTSSNKVRAYINSAWQDFITSATAVGGDVSGTVASISLPGVGSAGTYAYPSSVTTDAKGRVSAITAGSAPVSGVSTTGPIGNSGTSLAPNITWNPTAAFSNNGQQVTNFVFEQQATAPTGAVARAYVDTTLNGFRVYLNGAWRTLADVAAVVNSITFNVPFGNSGTATNPVPTLSLTTSNDGGAIIKQASSPGTAQTGSARVSVSLGADTRFYLNTVPILESGTTFPSSGLVDGQRYRNENYRSWFVFVSSDSKWRQESPGVFDGSFPTISSGDNSVAPKIEVKRRDKNGLVYYWNGADWLGPQIIATVPYIPGLAGNGITVNTNNVYVRAHPDNASDVYVEALQTTVLVGAGGGGNNATNYWTFTYKFRNSGAITAVTATVNTSTFTAATLTPLVLLNNTKITRPNFYDILIDVAKAGAVANPGTLFIEPMDFIYRLVG